MTSWPLALAHLDVLDARAAEQVDPRRPRLLARGSSRTAPGRAGSWGPGGGRRAALDALGEVAVVACRPPEPQPALVDLLLLEVLLEPDHVAEVVAGDLLRRLADLEGRLARRPVALLGDEDAGVGARLLDLDARASARRAPRRGSRRRRCLPAACCSRSSSPHLYPPYHRSCIAQPQHRRQPDPLHLVGARVDRRADRGAQVLLEPGLAHVAAAAEDLHRVSAEARFASLVDDLAIDDLARSRCACAANFSRRVVEVLARRLDADLLSTMLALDVLVAADRLAELLARLARTRCSARSRCCISPTIMMKMHEDLPRHDVLEDEEPAARLADHVVLRARGSRRTRARRSATCSAPSSGSARRP